MDLGVSGFLAPCAVALFVWWFATGAILFLDGRPRRTFRWSMAGATAVLIGACYAIGASAGSRTVGGAYVAFAAAILVWGWLEMSFLMGILTGPRKHACLERCSGWRHFEHAVGAILYNEIATLVAAAGIAAATWSTVNKLSLWTFCILWSMRISAKLNLFLGVPNLGEKFLPAHLQYLKSFFRKRAMNYLFPLSMSAATVAVSWLARDFALASDPATATGYALLTSLLALAVLEHWFMVLPIPSERMWRWAMRPSTGSAEGICERT